MRRINAGHPLSGSVDGKTDPYMRPAELNRSSTSLPIHG